MVEEQEEKPQPPSETVLEQKVNPDQAIFAEQAIHHYANWVLDQFRESLTSTLDGFGNWLISQGDPKMFDNAAFLEGAARVQLDQVMKLFGGAQTPIGQALRPMLDGAIDQAVRQESQASLFMTQLSRTARDACWYLRDNLQGVLAGQWDQLRDLAYEGSTEFIPVLHQLGLPRAELNTAALTAALTAEAERFRATIPLKQEAATKDTDAAKDPEPEVQKDQQDFASQEGKKQAV
jgi:hypothetical protein